MAQDIALTVSQGIICASFSAFSIRSWLVRGFKQRPKCGSKRQMSSARIKKPISTDAAALLDLLEMPASAN